MNTATGTVDAGEIAKFEAMAAEWWDPTGKFKPLHMMNPVRLDYITSQIAAEFGRDLKADKPFEGLRILDIGCGGGLLSEPMARLGADVVGADAAPRNIPVAQIHAEQSGLEIDYRHTTAEAMALYLPYQHLKNISKIYAGNDFKYPSAWYSIIYPPSLVGT